MNFVTFELMNTIRWRVPRDAPPVLPVECFDGWCPVNPLVYPDVLRVRGRPDIHHLQGLFEGDALVRTCMVVFAQKDNAPTPAPSFSDVLTLLSRWRHVSRQALLSASLLSIASRAGPFAHQRALAVRFPDEHQCRAAHITRKAVDGALAPHHLAQAAGLPDDFVTPIHDALLLDAVCAWLNADYRKAVLYSAIAVEALVNEKLEEALSRAITARGPEFRVVTIPGRTASTKDPIYEALADKTSFPRLVHERSLYLLNRSLLVDDPQLYALALRLYSTRNKIAHRGEPSAEQSSLLPLNLEGALLALDCAIRTFKWYGEGAGYSLPDQGHVEGLAFMGRTGPGSHEHDGSGVEQPLYLGTAMINAATVEVMAAMSPSEASSLGADREGEPAVD